MNTKPLFLTAALLAASLAAPAAIFETRDFDVGSALGDIPDDGSSAVFSQTISDSQISQLTEVRVVLSLSGNPAGTGWAGDMFASLNLNLGGQTAILLNQVGVNGGNPAGNGFNGWNITLQDGVPNGDVHLGQPTGPATILTGIWQPDGRLNPADSLRPSQLGVFNGSAGNGTWSLNLADLSAGGRMTLNSWSLAFTGASAVPEPADYAVLAGAALAAFALCRRRPVV